MGQKKINKKKLQNKAAAQIPLGGALTKTPLKSD